MGQMGETHVLACVSVQGRRDRAGAMLCLLSCTTVVLVMRGVVHVRRACPPSWWSSLSHRHNRQQPYMLCRMDSAEFEKGDLYIVRYQPVKDLLRDKWIAMV